MSYLFGANTGETQESLRRKREIARMLSQTNVGGAAPRNVGEALYMGGGLMGGALADRGLQKQEAAAEAEARAAYEAKLQGLPGYDEGKWDYLKDFGGTKEGRRMGALQMIGALAPLNKAQRDAKDFRDEQFAYRKQRDARQDNMRAEARRQAVAQRQSSAQREAMSKFVNLAQVHGAQNAMRIVEGLRKTGHDTTLVDQLMSQRGGVENVVQMLGAPPDQGKFEYKTFGPNDTPMLVNATTGEARPLQGVDYGQGTQGAPIQNADFSYQSPLRSTQIDEAAEAQRGNYMKERGKLFARERDEISQAATEAAMRRGDRAALDQAVNDPDVLFSDNFLAGPRNFASKMLAPFDSESRQAVQNMDIIDRQSAVQRLGFLSQLKGAASDKDLEEVARTVPSLGNTRAGMRAIIDIQNLADDAVMAINDFAARYEAEHGQIDAGWDQVKAKVLAQYSAEMLSVVKAAQEGSGGEQDLQQMDNSQFLDALRNLPPASQ